MKMFTNVYMICMGRCILVNLFCLKKANVYCSLAKAA